MQVFADDIPRSQLLFTRTIPGFDPSPESYALAEQFLEEGRLRAAAAGVKTPRDFDLYTALVSGLSTQQLANDPGGDRWLRLVDEAIDMLLDHTHRPRPSTRGTDDHDHHEHRQSRPSRGSATTRQCASRSSSSTA